MVGQSQGQGALAHAGQAPQRGQGQGRLAAGVAQFGHNLGNQFVPAIEGGGAGCGVEETGVQNRRWGGAAKLGQLLSQLLGQLLQTALPALGIVQVHGLQGGQFSGQAGDAFEQGDKALAACAGVEVLAQLGLKVGQTVGQPGWGDEGEGVAAGPDQAGHFGQPVDTPTQILAGGRGQPRRRQPGQEFVLHKVQVVRVVADENGVAAVLVHWHSSRGWVVVGKV